MDRLLCTKRSIYYGCTAVPRDNLNFLMQVAIVLQISLKTLAWYDYEIFSHETFLCGNVYFLWLTCCIEQYL